MKTKHIAITLLAATLAAPAFAGGFLYTWTVDDAGERSRERGSGQERSAEREERLYDEATSALDENDWRIAAIRFRKTADLALEHAPAALYWLAYAQNRMAQRSEALATLVELREKYGKSKWAEDGRALEVEIRQASGQHIEPEKVEDSDVRLMTLLPMIRTNPDKAIPMLDKLVASGTLKTKDRALFVLSQSDDPRAFSIIGRVARDGASPLLQVRAVRYLTPAARDESTRKLLGDVYAATPNERVKKTVLRTYAVANDRGRLVWVAKSESNPDLRAEAVRQLGVCGASGELSTLYTVEPSTAVRKEIIQAMFIGGNADKLIVLAQRERSPELRITAIQNLGLLGGESSSQALLTIYDSDPNPQVRSAVVQGLFLQQNGKALVKLKEKEKDPALKAVIEEKLALLDSIGH